MRVFFGYYWKVLKKTITESWDVAQTVLSVVAFGASIFASYNVGARKVTEYLTTWQFYAILLGVVIAMRIALAPYLLWLEQQKKYEVDVKLSEELTRKNNIAERANELKAAALKIEEKRFKLERRVASKSALADLDIAHGATFLIDDDEDE